MEEEMKRTKIIGLLAVMAMVAAACSSGTGDTTTTAADVTTTAAGDTTTTAGGDTTTTQGESDNPLAEYGEDPGAADMALVEKALGPVEPSDDDS
jgi:ABC-type glycerol-3-phosphate transport system substrate-binding protein